MNLIRTGLSWVLAVIIVIVFLGALAFERVYRRICYGDARGIFRRTQAGLTRKNG